MFKRKTFQSFKDNKGLSLIELTIVIALISILLMVAYQFFFQGLNIFSLGEERSEARQDTSVAAFTITNTIRNVKSISLTGQPGYTQLNIQGRYPRIQNTAYEVVKNKGKYSLAFTLTHEDGYEVVSEVLLNNVHTTVTGKGIEVWYLDAAAALNQPTISVGTSTGSLIAGVAGNIHFPVITTNIDNNETLTVALVGSPTGLSIAGSPTVNNNASNITVSSTSAATSGMYSFTVNYTGAAERMVTFFVGVNAPTITLVGDAVMTVSHGSAFTDPGATAHAPDESNITGSIVVSGDTINNSTPVGTYTIFYNVSHGGVPAPEVSRTVIVVSGVPTTITLTNISGLQPVNGATRIESISNYQFKASVSWAPTGSNNWTGSGGKNFKGKTEYTATITITTKGGFTLDGIGANTFTVANATSVTHAANSGVITAVFPETAN